jgi:hypothetical protein
MRSLGRIGKKELLDYVRLEEDEDTAELLLKASFLPVGSVVIQGVTFQFWSYPTPCGVAWVSFSSESVLSTEVEDNVPAHIRNATAPREKHPIRKPSRESAGPIDRSPIPQPKWIPFTQAPVCNYFPVWKEDVPFQLASKAFGAKPKRENVGYWGLYFCVKLTGGRYALIEAPEHDQGSIRVSLELEEDAETRKDENCLGFVRACDIKEVLGVLGREYVLPKFKYPYQWRE